MYEEVRVRRIVSCPWKDRYQVAAALERENWFDLGCPTVTSVSANAAAGTDEAMIEFWYSPLSAQADGRKDNMDKVNVEAAHTHHDYYLTIDGPEFRRQRKLLLKLRTLADNGLPDFLGPGDVEQLDGVIHLTDELADQAHDRHGIDCLLEESES